MTTYVIYLSRLVSIASLILASAFAAAGNIFFGTSGGGFGAVGSFSITGSATGSPDKLTLKAKVQVAPEDIGKQGAIYVIAAMPGMVFFRQPDGAWGYWVAGVFPANFQGTLGSHDINVVENFNLSLLPGLDFYVGYGTNQADMLLNQKYSKLSTNTQPIVLDGVWGMVSSTGTFFDLPPQYMAFDGTDTMAVVNNNGCAFAANYVASGNVLSVTVLYNNDSTACGPDDAPGAMHRFEFALGQTNLSLKAGDGSTALFQKIVIP